MKIKQGIPKDYRRAIVLWSYKYFKDIISKPDYLNIIENKTNWDISLILVNEEYDDEIIGIYLLGNTQLSDILETDKYNGLTGIEGVLLVVDETIRGMGGGNKLKNHIITLGYDYIWGQQLKTLNNLEDWVKRRKLIAETEDTYITAEFFSPF
jgi:GNAT superfamily N-acetyltransferase